MFTSLKVYRALHTLLFALIAFGVVSVLLFGAYAIRQNPSFTLAGAQAYVNGYADAYQYQRYSGESEVNAVKNVVLQSSGSAAADSDPAVSVTSGSVPVLLYHRIANDNDPYNVSTDKFKDQMFALKKAGYTTVSMSDYVAFVDGKKKLPAKSFLLTFDDGTKGSYYPVDPILKALDFRATTFVISKYSIDDPNGSKYYLSATELKAMSKSGRWDIEAHTKNGHTYYPIDAKGTKGYFYADKLWLGDKQRLETDQEFATRVTTDMQQVKSEIEGATHQPVVAFAFPFGDIGENDNNYPGAEAVLSGAVQKYYQQGFIQYFPGRGASQSYFDSQTTFTNRLEVPQWTGAQLLSFMDRGNAKSLPYSDGLMSDKGWQNGWGDMKLQNGTLEVTGAPGTTGGSALLDGTAAWADYTATFVARLIKGTSYAITARNHGITYRVGCSFSNNYVAIDRQTTADGTEVASMNTPITVTDPNTVGIAVHGNQVSCLVNGQVVVSGNDATMPPNGGVGTTVWDRSGNAVADFKNLIVTPL